MVHLHFLSSLSDKLTHYTQKAAPKGGPATCHDAPERARTCLTMPRAKPVRTARVVIKSLACLPVKIMLPLQRRQCYA